MSKEQKELLIRVENCTKSFSGVIVFENVSFELYAGEIHCLLGENGAGKSTFIKILSGAYVPDSGTVEICGKRINNFSPDVIKKLGLATIYQNQFLMPDLTVAENIFMGNYKYKAKGIVSYKQMHDQALNILKEIGQDISPDILVSELDVTERQIVQIAKALANNARILILDEPTASLGNDKIRTLLDLVKQIAGRGIGIIYISHHLSEVFELADKVTVLRDGRKISCYSKEEINEDQLIRDMVGRDTSLFYKRDDIEKGNGTLIVEGLYKKNYLESTSFSMRQGEILGFGGMTGSGRTELAMLLFGAKKPDAGRVLLNGKDVTSYDPNMAIKNGICLITEDRQLTGMFMEHSIGWNFSSASINKKNEKILHDRKTNKALRQYIQDMHIKTQGVDQEIGFLSGGNQQKVILAKWMFTEASIIIFDEPTKGIDIGAKEDVYKLMLDLAREGKYIIMISSDMPELIAMSDRVAVMKNKKLVAVIEKENITEENILSYSLGG